VLGVIAIASLGVVLSAAAAAITLTGNAPDDGALAARQALIVGVPIAVGLYAWREGTHRRFGRLLVLAGVTWFLTTLSGSDDGVLYSIGRVSGWLVEVGLVYLMLAFPTGRLAGPVDRALFWAAAALVASLYVPTALVAEQYPVPSLWTHCDAGCPENAFMLLDSEPGFVDGVVRPLREVLSIAVLIAVTGRLAQRIGRATPLLRRTLTPVLAFAILRALALGIALGVRRVDPGSPAVDVFAWVTVLAIPAMSLGFLIGLLRWRLFAAEALQGLALGVRSHSRQEELRDLIAATLGDPTVELAYWRPARGGNWVDAAGLPVALPAERSGRCITEIRDGDRRVAAIVHDPALREQRSFVESVGAYALVWDDNIRLAAEVEASLREVRESRARILAAADDERRRIERDLHDGAQQRLVALRIRLEIADEVMLRDPARARQIVHGLGDEVTGALDEVRSLAAGVYPALLAHRGLTEALRAAALRSPVPARVDVDGVDRFPQEVEAAVYFCCSEALQNAAKHARGASSVSISLERNGDLRFEVRDDGAGFSPLDAGSGHGLLNMRDRLASVGGELDVRSAPGEGTQVSGSVPAP
jgi:signal transduction histidine kinase